MKNPPLFYDFHIDFSLSPCNNRNVYLCYRKGGIDMDIASLSTSLSMANVQNDFGVLMLSKQLDTVEDMGDSMIKLMEQSVNPHLGGNIDISL